MTDPSKAAEMALEFVEWLCGDDHSVKPKNSALQTKEALRQALAQPVDAVNMSQERVDETAKREHEPWQSVQCTCGGTIYFKHTKREWVGLTDEEIDDWFFQRLKQAGDGWALDDVVRAVEAKLKEKNGG